VVGSRKPDVCFFRLNYYSGAPWGRKQGPRRAEGGGKELGLFEQESFVVLGKKNGRARLSWVLLFFSGLIFYLITWT
jgi:hypothetical protein